MDALCAMEGAALPESIIIKPAIARAYENFWRSERVLFFSAPCGFGKTAVTVEASHNRGQPVAEPRTENNTESKQIVYERSGTQLFRAMMPNHQRIGKPQHNDSQLPHHNG